MDTEVELVLVDLEVMVSAKFPELIISFLNP